MAKAIARISKQKGGGVGASAEHNERKRETPNADPDKKNENKTIIGDKKPVQEKVKEVIAEHGGKPRADSVEAVEVLLTGSPHHFKDTHGEIDKEKVEQFCKAAKKFLLDKRNGGICVKAILHMDERTPHIQAHMVPIDPNGKLNCKHYFGSREKLSAFQDRFAEAVEHLGLERGEKGSRAKHTDIKKFYASITKDHEIEVQLEKLPDPPRMLITEDSRNRYKEEITRAVIEQVKEPIQAQLHQAMLARDERDKRIAYKVLADEKVNRNYSFLNGFKEQLINEHNENINLNHENKTLRSEIKKYKVAYKKQSAENETLKTQVSDLETQLTESEERIQDIDQRDVYRTLIKEGLPQVSPAVKVKNGMATEIIINYDTPEQQTISTNAVELVQYMYGTNGQEMTIADTINWLSGHYGEARAASAYLFAASQQAEYVLDQKRIEEANRARELENANRMRDEAYHSQDKFNDLESHMNLDTPGSVLDYQGYAQDEAEGVGIEMEEEMEIAEDFALCL